jgi:CYTH domain-containing protein
MPQEIERKFLVRGDAWREGAHATRYTQGYLSRVPGRTVRIRRAGEKAFITIKGRNTGISRPEYEYAIPVTDAEELFPLCEGPLIEKTRHVVEHGGKRWEIDVFHGDNDGLVMAEIELKSEDESFDRPEWIGMEVSSDRRYYNSSLSMHPYKEWK